MDWVMIIGVPVARALPIVNFVVSVIAVSVALWVHFDIKRRDKIEREYLDSRKDS